MSGGEPVRKSGGGLLGRIAKVSSFLRSQVTEVIRHPETIKPKARALGAAVKEHIRKEKYWMIASAGVGIAASTMASGFIGVAGAGILATSFATNMFRYYKENAQARYTYEHTAGDYAGQYHSMPGLFLRSVVKDNVKFLGSGKFWGRLLTSTAISSATFGLMHGFSFGVDTPSALANVAPKPDLHSHFAAAAQAAPVEQAAPVAAPAPASGSASMDINDKIMANVDAYNSHGKVLTTDGYTVSPSTVSLTEQINDVYHNYWGHGGFKADPEVALRAMKDLAENAGTAKGRAIAQEFVDQWTGKHPMNVSPVQVVEQRMAEAAAKKAAQATELAGNVAVQKASAMQEAFHQMDMENAQALQEESTNLQKDLAVQEVLKESQAEEIARSMAEEEARQAVPAESVLSSKDIVPVTGKCIDRLKEGFRMVLNCRTNVPEYIARWSGRVDVEAPLCNRIDPVIKADEFVCLDGEPYFKRFNAASENVLGWVGDKMQWHVGQKVEQAMNAYDSAYAARQAAPTP
ncbi:MAG TPA: hypothetical protein PKI93_01895 [Alphaproteobacteria bacterium]|nr:hypothetical protein [Alphaproteobacteria bacterium]